MTHFFQSHLDVDTPAGWVRVLAGAGGIYNVFFRKDKTSSPTASKPHKKVSGILNQTRRWFEDDYWGQTKKPFPWDLIDCSGSTPFQQRVWKLLWEIPYGEVATYREIAKKMGLNGGAQAVGQANKRNPVPIIIPCHRVIAADGSLGEYAPGVSYKEKLLQHEGVLPPLPDPLPQGEREGDIHFMKVAISEAKKAAKTGEVPIGALLVRSRKIIARGYNQRERSRNPLQHAEMIALEDSAKKMGNWRLSEATLYVTLEPCPMCLGALLQARVNRLVFGCADPNRNSSFVPTLEGKTEISGNNHSLDIRGGVLEKECSKMLKEFFKSLR